MDAAWIKSSNRSRTQQLWNISLRGDKYKALNIHHSPEPSRCRSAHICVFTVVCLFEIIWIFWHMPLLRELLPPTETWSRCQLIQRLKQIPHTHTKTHSAQILASTSDAVWPQLIWSESPVIMGEGGTGFLLIGKFCKWHHWSKLTVVRILAKWGNWLGKSSVVVPESTNKLIIKAELNNNSCYFTWMQIYLCTHAYVHT